MNTARRMRCQGISACLTNTHEWQHLQVVDEDHKRSYWFACGKWLATNMDDGLLERTLLALDKDPRSAYTDYKVRLHSAHLLSTFLCCLHEWRSVCACLLRCMVVPWP